MNQQLEQHTQTASDLWTPSGVSKGGMSVVGRNVETGQSIVTHTFHFKDALSGRRLRVPVLADLDTSQAQIEDMAAHAFERWMEEIRTDSRKRLPTAQEKKDIGHAIEEFRKYQKKRRESTTGKIYF